MATSAFFVDLDCLSVGAARNGHVFVGRVPVSSACPIGRLQRDATNDEAHRLTPVDAARREGSRRSAFQWILRPPRPGPAGIDMREERIEFRDAEWADRSGNSRDIGQI